MGQERSRSHSNTLMKAEILCEWDRFFQLEPEWNELLGRSRADTIFLR